MIRRASKLKWRGDDDGGGITALNGPFDVYLYSFFNRFDVAFRRKRPGME
jgi:hypothetical protein